MNSVLGSTPRHKPEFESPDNSNDEDNTARPPGDWQVVETPPEDWQVVERPPADWQDPEADPTRQIEPQDQIGDDSSAEVV